MREKWKVVILLAWHRLLAGSSHTIAEEYDGYSRQVIEIVEDDEFGSDLRMELSVLDIYL
jgi:hypothetical protein